MRFTDLNYDAKTNDAEANCANDGQFCFSRSPHGTEPTEPSQKECATQLKHDKPTASSSVA